MNPDPDLPDAAERTRLNSALLATGAETGFWDDHGLPAPWPDDIDDWRPGISEPITPNSPETVF